MAKRASERYSTAKDLADDLRHFMAEQTLIDSGTSPGGIATVASETMASQVASTSTGSVAASSASIGSDSSSDSQPIKIVPKGLRSFDAHDADFFLELLPGPRDRGGLPDGLRFWKTRIEETDPDNTFSVGLIYGPSGCGKSSLVKAGLLPRLSEDVIPIYIEATRDETEPRLLYRLRKRCPALEDNLSLKDTLAALRCGQGIPVGKKVLIVLDQFEQWLHAKKEEENTELVQALRQCDGGRVQCILMVRDDFWMAVTRFLRELEVRLLEDQNLAAVDLFPARHAQKVLAAFGRAFGALPDDASKTLKEQKNFLEQSVTGLAEEGKVNCVRLALFAEMMKGKPWTPATFQEVGGTKGVGVTFLEETFSSSTASPEHRYQQKAARAVLKSLLPDSGTDIKGHMKSYDVLLEASGYARHPKDFDDLICILDSEIRLITPTDPEGVEADDDIVSHTEVGQKYYQLTHDYLVPSLRDWLVRKQKETQLGRAEILLAERAALWRAKSENRYLPTFLEWLRIERFVPRHSRTPVEAETLRKARQVHVTRATITAVLLMAVATVGWAMWRHSQAKAVTARAHLLVGRLIEARIVDVPGVLQDIIPVRARVDEILLLQLANVEEDSVVRQRIAMGLVHRDATQRKFLVQRALIATPDELAVLVEILMPYQAELNGSFWDHLQNQLNARSSRLRAACVLAANAPSDARWESVVADVVAAIVAEPTVVVGRWADMLRPIRDVLRQPLHFMMESQGESQYGLAATSVIAEYWAESEPSTTVRLALQAKPKHVVLLMGKLRGTQDPLVREQLLANWNGEALGKETAFEEPVRNQQAKQRVRAGLGLLAIGAATDVFASITAETDPRVTSYLIDQIADSGIEHRDLVGLLPTDLTPSALRVIMLAIAQYPQNLITPNEREPIVSELLRHFETHPDAGVHSAARFAIETLGESSAVAELEAELIGKEFEPANRWFVNSVGQTFSVVMGPREQIVGASVHEGASPERLQRVYIGRSFAIGVTEVTEREYSEFTKQTKNTSLPAANLTWFDAARFCRWLSEKEHLPEDQMCYPSIDAIREGMTLPEDYLDRTGYRLPTESEWECACRSGTTTPFTFGSDNQLLEDYAHYERVGAPWNTLPVATRMPNGFGLFDVHGNVDEWCAEAFSDVPRVLHVIDTMLDRDSEGSRVDSGKRTLRSGMFSRHLDHQYSGARRGLPPAPGYSDIGFRIVRTIRSPAFGASRVSSKLNTQIELTVTGDPAIYQVEAVSEGLRVVTKEISVPGRLRLEGDDLEVRSIVIQLKETGTQTQRLIQGHLGDPELSTNTHVNSIGMRLVAIPAGQFMMGSSQAAIEDLVDKIHVTVDRSHLESEGPQHRVEISQPFLASTTEITVGQFKQFVEQTGYRTEAERRPRSVKGAVLGGWRRLPRDANWRQPGFPDFELSDEHPVVMVTWHDAIAFCEWLSKEDGRTYRLPTEAEWEYLARAGHSDAWSFGGEVSKFGLHGWARFNCRSVIRPVASKIPNRFGLYDVHGNVWEWCVDRYSADYYPISPNRDPTGPPIESPSEPTALRVLRGGGILERKTFCHSARRFPAASNSYSNTWGFRVVSPLDRLPPRLAARFEGVPTQFYEDEYLLHGDIKSPSVVPASGMDLTWEIVESSPKRLLMRSAPFNGVQSVKLRQGSHEFALDEIIRPFPWQVSFFAWDGATLTPTGNWPEITSHALERRVVTDINVDWRRSAPSERVPTVFFAMVAESEFVSSDGVFEIAIDGVTFVRVFIDNIRVFDRWQFPLQSRSVESFRLREGKHSIRVEFNHFESGAKFRYAIRKKR